MRIHYRLRRTRLVQISTTPSLNSRQHRLKSLVQKPTHLGSHFHEENHLNKPLPNQKQLRIYKTKSLIIIFIFFILVTRWDLIAYFKKF